MRDGNADASKRVIGPMPDCAARIAGHADATPMPTGETSPSPVTTTRRRLMGGSGGWAAGVVRCRSAPDEAPDALQQAVRNGTGRPRPQPAWASLLVVGGDVVDCLLDRGDLLGFVVRDLGLEFLLERHHELHRVERVRTEVVDERRLVLDLGLVDAELLGHDLLHPLLNVLHATPP